MAVKWNAAMTDGISSTSAFTVVTSLNVSCEVRPYRHSETGAVKCYLVIINSYFNQFKFNLNLKHQRATANQYQNYGGF